MVRWSQSFAYAFLVLYALSLLIVIVFPPRAPLYLIVIVTLSSVFFFLFALFHGWYTLGPKRLGTLLGLTFVIAFAMEAVGVITDWPFGPYHYTRSLGPKILGLVPGTILIAWFMMVYTTQQVVERIVAPYLPPRLSIGRGLWLCVLTAMALTAWDLVMDPLMVSRRHWVWEVRGAYFGIPVQNYVGWMLTGFLIYGAYYLVYPDVNTPKEGASLPVWAYTFTWLANVTVAYFAGFWGPALVGFFAMGAFSLLGLGTLGREGHPLL